MTTQGIPDDLLPAEELPLDIVGALQAAINRLATLEYELIRIRWELVRLRDAMKERQR